MVLPTSDLRGFNFSVCVYSEGQSEGADMWRSLTEGMDVWDWEFWPS